MATIIKSFNPATDEVNNLFTEADLTALENKTFANKKPLVGVEYSPQTTTGIKGKWVANKTLIKRLEKDEVWENLTDEVKKTRVSLTWSVVFETIPSAENEPKQTIVDLSITFLNNPKSHINPSGAIIQPKGDIRQWFQLRALPNVTHKTLCENLATELNTRGLIFEADVAEFKKKSGGTFTVNYYQPYFADTHE
jgi:hypothetical protein